MECAGNGRAHVEPHVVSQPWLLEAVGTARWRGTPVAGLLEEAGVADGASDVLFTGLDRGVEGGEEQDYARSVPLAEVLAGDALLAYEVNGVPLPPQHGFPLRLVVPGWYGMTSVKWLARITLLDAPHDGYQMRHGYRFRQHEDEEGEPITRIQLRSLMIPPGIPEFLSRARIVRAGRCELAGRAWAGRRGDRRRGRLDGRRRDMGRGASSATRRSAAGHGARGRSSGTPSRRARALQQGARLRGPEPAAGAALERRRLREQRRAARGGHACGSVGPPPSRAARRLAVSSARVIFRVARRAPARRGFRGREFGRVHAERGRDRTADARRGRLPTGDRTHTGVSGRSG